MEKKDERKILKLIETETASYVKGGDDEESTTEK
jgi:hypothetical protein